MKDLLTATRLSTLQTCPRRHYWRYEVGLLKERDGDALRFGSAWHRAMEARATGADAQAAFLAAIGDRQDLDEFQVATLSGMLAGYYARYKEDEIEAVHPEVEFRYPLSGSRTFDVAGKIDGLCHLVDGRPALVEHKTAGCDIGPASDYWLRLRGNTQVMQYLLAAREIGWPAETILYDVARKPEIAPRQNVPRHDADGLKVVLSATGERVMKKDGTPKQTADREKGETLDGAPETHGAFGDRLAEDTLARPEFYFARREVPVLHDDLEEFEAQRLVLARLILSCRAEARHAKRPEHGWPRNVSDATCRYCDFAGFCLQNATVDPSHPPAGFRVGPCNPDPGALRGVHGRVRGRGAEVHVTPVQALPVPHGEEPVPAVQLVG